jgi:hypothetical protein
MILPRCNRIWPFEELAAGEKAGHHLLFDQWRDATEDEKPARYAEFDAALELSRKRYGAAWQAALARLHLDDNIKLVDSLGVFDQGEVVHQVGSGEGTFPPDAALAHRQQFGGDYRDPAVRLVYSNRGHRGTFLYPRYSACTRRGKPASPAEPPRLH